MSANATLPRTPGVSPVYFGQDVYRFTTMESRCLATAGQHARLFTVNVNTALAGCKVCIFDGVSAMSGTLVACIDASAAQSYHFGGIRFPKGIYVQVTGTGTPDITFGMDAALDGGELTFSGGLITDATRVANTQGDGITEPYALTTNGNEVTDASRSATLTTASSGQMMDGRTVPDSSYGVRRAATNLFGRGQCDALGATDWIAGGASPVVATDATVAAPFSPQSVKLTSSLAGIVSMHARSATGLAIAAATNIVGSIYFLGAVGQGYSVRVRVNNTDASLTDGTVTNFNATGAWQLLAPAGVPVAVGKTGDSIEVLVSQTGGARVESVWLAHAMLESGQTVLAPYVATTGGATATHSGGRVRAPILTNTTRGWAAMKLRMGYASTDAGGVAGVGFVLSDGTVNNRISVLNGNGFWASRRVAGGVAGTTATQNIAWAAGDLLTVVLAWDATTIYVSVNGVAFTTAANANTFTPTTLDIGSNFGSGNWIDSDVMWFAMGTGAVSSADLARFNFGDPSYMSDLPSEPALFWDCSSPVITPLADSSTGIWEGTTNSWTNGGMETNNTGWAGVGTVAATISRDATVSKFGSASLKVICSGANTGEGGSYSTASRVAAVAGQTWTQSMWVLAPAGTTLNHTFSGFDGGGAGVGADTVAIAFVATGAWQRIGQTVTLTGGTTAGITQRVVTNVTPQAVTFWLDGAQTEQKAAPTPYVETNGAAAARTTATVTAPASVLDETQGWVAMRVRAGWSNNVVPSPNTTGWFSWFDDVNNRIILFFSSTTTIRLFRIGGGVGGGPCNKAGVSFNIGDYLTIVAYWTSAALGVSLNGSVFTTAAPGTIPVLAASTFSLDQAGTKPDCDYEWFACGTGTLTDADAATFNAWGNTDPRVADFPTAAGVTMIWHGSGTQYITP